MDEALAALRDDLDRAARRPPGGHRRPARRPDGQHLEPLPVHGDVQPVALRVDVRVGHRPRHGVPGLQPGPAGLRPHDPGASPRRGSWTSPRPSCPTAAPITSTSRSRSAATTTSAPGSTTTPRGSSSASRPTSRRPATWRSWTIPVPWDNEEGSETPLHDHLRRCIDFTLAPARPARAAAHRAGGLERLPQPQRLLRPSPASPSRRPRTAPAASPSPCSSPACSCSPRTRPRRSPACAAMTREAARCRAGGAVDDRVHRGVTAGTAPGTGAPTTTSGTPWGRPRTTRARSSSSRRG